MLFFHNFNQTGERAFQQHTHNLIQMAVLCYYTILNDFTLFLDVFLKTTA